MEYIVKRPIVRAAAFTHQGRVRRRNEDCIAVGGWMRSAPMTEPVVLSHALDRPVIALIADGMGGHPAGDVASRFAAERLNAGLPQACDSDEALRKALLRVNHELIAEARKEPARIGMGTTVAGVAVLPGEVAVFNIGDSRVYRVDAGELEQLSIDDVPHYYIPALGVELRTGELTQHLGGLPYEIPIQPHVVRLPIAGAQTWLLCSDGLYDMVDDETIAAAISEDMAATVHALFAAAMSAGGADNISIILLRLERNQGARATTGSSLEISVFQDGES